MGQQRQHRAGGHGNTAPHPAQRSENPGCQAGRTVNGQKLRLSGQRRHQSGRNGRGAARPGRKAASAEQQAVKGQHPRRGEPADLERRESHVKDRKPHAGANSVGACQRRALLKRAARLDEEHPRRRGDRRFAADQRISVDGRGFGEGHGQPGHSNGKRRKQRGIKLNPALWDKTERPAQPEQQNQCREIAQRAAAGGKHQISAHRPKGGGNSVIGRRSSRPCHPERGGGQKDGGTAHHKSDGGGKELFQRGAQRGKSLGQAQRLRGRHVH